jgi:hypothetical protein
MCKENTTGKWDYMGKVYIVELMEEMDSIYRNLNYKLKHLLQLHIKRTKPLQMSYCNHTFQAVILLSVTFHWVIIQCEHEDSNPLIHCTVQSGKKTGISQTRQLHSSSESSSPETGNYLAVDTVQLPRRLKSSSTLLSQPQTSRMWPYLYMLLFQ